MPAKHSGALPFILACRKPFNQKKIMKSVLIVGAGPVGLMMAAELARHGVACRIVEKMEEPTSYCRALGITPRTMEIFEDIGIASQVMDAGIWLNGKRIDIQG